MRLTSLEGRGTRPVPGLDQLDVDVVVAEAGEMFCLYLTNHLVGRAGALTRCGAIQLAICQC